MSKPWESPGFSRGGAVKRIYLSGAMTGCPDLNFPAFHAAAKALRAKGHDVVNPAEIKPEGEPSWSACMRADLKAMLDCCTVALLPGWEDSKGANIEARLAIQLGMRVVEFETLIAEVA